MKKWVVIGFLTSCLFVAACDTDRLAKLEKENADLKAKVEKQSTVADYDLQAKCSKDARAWFNENWSGDKDTILLTFTNHYSSKLNRCFILVEYHYNSRLAGPGGESWTNAMSLTDVYENAKYAEFDENHYTYYKPQFSTHQEVITCVVQGKKCQAGAEFNNLVSPFMNN